MIVYDPYTTESFGAVRAGSLEEALSGADAIVIVTDHPEFKDVDLDKASKLVRHRVIIDGRRVVEPHQAVKHGFKYYGVGYGRAFKL
jgi:UDP-N-acetyl-D-mannosaminuronate dehydrogenase